MIEAIMGLVVSVLAALIYRDFRLEGERSTLKRIVAFGLGFPWSVIVLATVAEPRPDRDAGADEETDLLEEVRRERRALDADPDRDRSETPPRSSV